MKERKEGKEKERRTAKVSSEFKDASLPPPFLPLLLFLLFRLGRELTKM